MKLDKMSDKTKEAHAEFLLKFSNNMITAFFVTVIIAPMGVIISQFISKTSEIDTSWGSFLNIFYGWQGITFITLEATAYYLSVYTQNRAYEIYNELDSET